MKYLCARCTVRVLAGNRERDSTSTIRSSSRRSIPVINEALCCAGFNSRLGDWNALRQCNVILENWHWSVVVNALTLAAQRLGPRWSSFAASASCTSVQKHPPGGSKRCVAQHCQKFDRATVSQQIGLERVLPVPYDGRQRLATRVPRNKWPHFESITSRTCRGSG